MLYEASEKYSLNTVKYTFSLRYNEELIKFEAVDVRILSTE